LALIVLACVGCSTRVVVRVDADEDGSGRVAVTAVLDREAAERTGGVAEALRVDDLRRAGWTVSVGTPAANGSVTVRVTQPFADPTEAEALLAQLSGPAGPLRDFSVERKSLVVATRSSLRGTVDLTQGFGTFGDDALQKSLAGTTPIGIDDAELRRQLGVDPADALRFSMAAKLAGADVRTWDVRLGARQDVAARATVWRTDVLVPLGVAGAVLLVLVVGRLVIRPPVPSRRRPPPNPRERVR
jgi:hypothetical protein